MAFNPYQMNYPNQGYVSQIHAQNSVVQPSSPLIWVQGEAGARAYLVAPNTTVDLWDSEAPIIYLKSADASGMPSMKIIDYKIRDNASQTSKFTSNSDFITKDDLFSIESRLDDLEGKFESLNKPSTRKKEAKDE